MQLEQEEIKDMQSTLIRIAASMFRYSGFISCYAEDNPKRTPKSILKQAAKQEEILRSWGFELKSISDKLYKLLGQSYAIRRISYK